MPPTFSGIFINNNLLEPSSNRKRPYAGLRKVKLCSDGVRLLVSTAAERYDD
jgi:hypothetical protein